MEIRIPMVEKSQELSGGRIFWTSDTGRICVRKILMVSSNAGPNQLTLVVAGHGNLELKEKFTLLRNVLK